MSDHQRQGFPDLVSPRMGRYRCINAIVPYHFSTSYKQAHALGIPENNAHCATICLLQQLEQVGAMCRIAGVPTIIVHRHRMEVEMRTESERGDHEQEILSKGYLFERK